MLSEATISANLLSVHALIASAMYPLFSKLVDRLEPKNLVSRTGILVGSDVYTGTLLLDVL